MTTISSLFLYFISNLDIYLHVMSGCIVNCNSSVLTMLLQ